MEYERLLKRYFDKSVMHDEKSVIEIQIETLKYFLENADFEDLRNSYPELSGDNEISVFLNLTDDDKYMNLTLNNSVKEVKWKK